MKVREPWERGRHRVRRRVLEFRARPWSLVPRSRGVEPERGHQPPRPSGTPLYEHHVLLCPSYLLPLVVFGYGAIVIAIDPGEGSRLISIPLLLSVPIIVAPVIVPRTSRWIRVDEDGLWVSGHLAVPADEIRAVVPLSMFAAGGAPSDRLGRLSWTTLYPLAGVSELVDRPVVAEVVGTPLDWDGQNTGGAFVPGALVVTGRVESGLPLAWALPSYRRAQLVSALVEVADRVDEPRPTQRAMDVPADPIRSELHRRFLRRPR